jgi:hypothetical protein
MHMFGGMALAAVAILLVIFLVVYPLFKSIVPKSAVVLVDILVGILLLAICVGLVATFSVHLIVMGILVLSFGSITLLVIRNTRKSRC